MRFHFFSAVLLCLFPLLTRSQVVINEFSAANMSGITDNFGEREDWIELYNAGNQAVDLSGYYLSDKINNTDKWKFPAGIFIEPGEFKLIFASDRDTVIGSFIHAGFKITQTKPEYIALFDASQNLLDAQQTTQPNQANHSTGRVTDGGTSWGIFAIPTPGGPNALAYQGYASTPVANMPAGFYNNAVTVSLSAEGGATIRYTLDGSEPGPNSTTYTEPVLITQTSVLKAKAFSNNTSLLPGFTLVNSYFINVSHTLIVVSVAGTDVANLFGGTQFHPWGSIEFFKNGQRLDWAYGEFNKHGNDSWAYAQRGVDYITRDQMGYKSSISHKFFETTDRDKFQRLILKAAANDNFPALMGGAHIRDAYVQTLSQKAGLDLDERSWEPCVLYLNGQYWGVYDIREKVDDPDFTRYYYDQGEKWLDYIKTWGGTWNEYGSRTDWDALHNFITTEDMTIPSNYNYVKERLNLLSLIDYMLINTHVVCKDWLNWNTGWWRGRKPDGGAKTWRYTLWDLDATFGHYTNYTSIPDVSPNADPCYAEDLPLDFEGHGAMIQALMANEEFHSLYVNRYADLLNSYFSCDYMISLLDSMLARITPEMPGQIQRWGGTMMNWQANVQILKSFINTRCQVINPGIEGCYDVTGPYPVTVRISPALSPNQVKVNTFVPDSFPFVGDYFVGTKLDFQALPGNGWVLDHWEVQHNVFQPNQFAEVIQLGLTDTLGEVVTAFFRPAIPCAPAANFHFDSTYSSLHLNWQGPVNALSYELGYRKAGTGEEWTTLSLTVQDYTIYGLEVCTQYEVRIRSICDFSVGQYENFVLKTACLTGTEQAASGVLEWNVFPNPFQDQLSLDFVLSKGAEVQVHLTNLAGQVLYSLSPGYLPAGQHRLRLEVEPQWSSGLYFVQLIAEEGRVVKKVVKQ